MQSQHVFWNILNRVLFGFDSSLQMYFEIIKSFVMSVRETSVIKIVEENPEPERVFHA